MRCGTGSLMPLAQVTNTERWGGKGGSIDFSSLLCFFSGERLRPRAQPPRLFGGARPLPASRSHVAERARPQSRAEPTARACPCGACAAPPPDPGSAEMMGSFPSLGGASSRGPIECVHRTKLPNRSAEECLKGTARREAAVGGLSRGRGVFVWSGASGCGLLCFPDRWR